MVTNAKNFAETLNESRFIYGFLTIEQSLTKREFLEWLFNLNNLQKKIKGAIMLKGGLETKE